MIIDSQILSDRARAENAAKIALSFDGINPEYVSLVEDQLPADYVEDSGSPIGAYLTSEGLMQKVSWNSTTLQWDNFGSPTPTKAYLIEQFFPPEERAVMMADRWRLKFSSDPQEWEQSQIGFGGHSEFADQTLAYAFSQGSRHNLSESPLFFVRSKDRFGWEWHDPVQVDFMEGVDIRNGALLVGENQNVLALFSNRQISPAVTLDQALYFSTDEGATWTKQTYDLGITPHGDIIELPTRYLTAGYAGGAEYVRIIEIAKDFSAVSVVHELDSTHFDASMDPADFQISEATIEKITDDVIIGTIRNQTPPGAIMQFYSEDAGVTWSNIFATNIFAGATPHKLFNDGTYVYMFFPSRIGAISPSLPAPAMEEYGRNYMLSYKPVDKILDMSSAWSFPTPLFPIPPHGSDTNGDVERGHLFKRDGQLYLMWKQGTYMDNTEGESVQWIKNIGRFS